MSSEEMLKQLRLRARQAVEIHACGRREGDPDATPYLGTTFLYIRAYEEDIGERPVPSGIVEWLSPDIELFDQAGVRITTSEIRPSMQYNVEVTVNNAGDHDCHSCQVELYLDRPSVGARVAATQTLGAQVVAVPAGGRTSVRFPFVASPDATGHHCLFARAFSIPSNDYPSSWRDFNAAADRHVAQQNLDIVVQGTEASFDIHLPEGLADHDLKLVVRASRPRMPRSRMLESRRLATRGGPFRGISIRKGLREKVSVTTKGVDSWTIRPEASDVKMALRIPMLELSADEMLPVSVQLIDDTTGASVGGITLVVAG